MSNSNAGSRRLNLNQLIQNKYKYVGRGRKKSFRICKDIIKSYVEVFQILQLNFEVYFLHNQYYLLPIK